MFKKLIPAIIFFLIGTAIIIIGTLFKILHWELHSINGGFLIAIGSITQVIAIAIAIIILISIYLKK